MKEILEECKIKYPVGTIFNSTGGYRNCKIEKNSTLEYTNEDVRVITNNKFIGCLYSKSKNEFATIISLPQPQEIQYEIC